MPEQFSYSPTILTSRAIYRAEGARAQEFLQGALTCDARMLVSSAVVYGVLLQPQGKLIADVFLFMSGGSYFLDLPVLCESEALAKLKLYATGRGISLIKEEAIRCLAAPPPPSLSEVRFDWLNGVIAYGVDPRCSYLGNRIYIDPTLSCGWLREQSATDPAGLSMNGDGSGGGRACFSMQKSGDGSDNVVLPAHGYVLMYHADGERNYRTLRTLAGACEAGTDYPANDRYPLDLALEELGAISFTKGCYAGQEVTARMRSRAAKRKRPGLFRREDGASLESPAEPPPCRFYLEDGSSFVADMMVPSGPYVLGVVAAELLLAPAVRCRSECGTWWILTRPFPSDTSDPTHEVTPEPCQLGQSDPSSPVGQGMNPTGDLCAVVSERIHACRLGALPMLAAKAQANGGSMRLGMPRGMASENAPTLTVRVSEFHSSNVFFVASCRRRPFGSVKALEKSCGCVEKNFAFFRSVVFDARRRRLRKAPYYDPFAFCHPDHAGSGSVDVLSDMYGLYSARKASPLFCIGGTSSSSVFDAADVLPTSCGVKFLFGVADEQASASWAISARKKRGVSVYGIGAETFSRFKRPTFLAVPDHVSAVLSVRTNASSSALYVFDKPANRYGGCIAPPRFINVGDIPSCQEADEQASASMVFGVENRIFLRFNQPTFLAGSDQSNAVLSARANAGPSALYVFDKPANRYGGCIVPPRFINVGDIPSCQEAGEQASASLVCGVEAETSSRFNQPAFLAVPDHANAVPSVRANAGPSALYVFDKPANNDGGCIAPPRFIIGDMPSCQEADGQASASMVFGVEDRILSRFKRPAFLAVPDHASAVLSVRTNASSSALYMFDKPANTCDDCIVTSHHTCVASMSSSSTSYENTLPLAGDNGASAFADRETRVKRLVYRSMYRGCKETDFLFGKLLDLRPETFTDEQLSLYEALLDSSDPDVYAWLTGALPFPAAFGVAFPALILSVTAPERASSSD